MVNFSWDALLDRVGEGATRAGFKFPEATAAEIEAGTANPQAGQWNRDRIGQTLGMLGAALAPEGSWQQRLGMVPAAIGTSNIYRKAAEKVQSQNLMDKILASLGKGITPAGAEGATKLALDKNGGFTVSGDLAGGTPAAPGVGPGTSVGGMTPEAITLGGEGVGGALPSSGGGAGGAPGGGTPSMDKILEALSNFQDSSARLTSADFAGLSPEMINALMGRQMEGQRTGLEAARIVSELMRTDPGKIVTLANGNFGVIRDNGTVQDTGVGSYQEPGAPVTRETAQGIVQWNPSAGKWESTGLTPWSAPKESPWSALTTINYYDPKTGKPGATTVPFGEADNTRQTLMAKGYTLGSAPTPPKPGDVSKERELSVANEVTVRNKELDIQERKNAINVFNDIAIDSTYGWVWSTGDPDPTKVELPPGVTMADVQAEAKRRRITTTQALKKLKREMSLR